MNLNLFRIKTKSVNEMIATGGSGHVKLPRTLESTIFEIVWVAVTVVTWIVILRENKELEEPVPTHFDLEGNPNGHSSLLIFYLILAFMSAASAFFMFYVAYRPRFVNVATDKTQKDSMRQLKLKGQLGRVLAILLALQPLAFSLTARNGNPVYVIGMVAVLSVVCVVYSILIHLNR